jgi:hypothetical protein
MLSWCVAFFKCCAVFLYAECRCAEWHFAKYYYADCCYAECRYAECPGAYSTPSERISMLTGTILLT